MFPGITVFDRATRTFDAFDEAEVLDAVKKTGRKQLVVSGLWTSMCMTITALRGLREGFDVYGVMDTTSSESKDAYKMAVHRMIQAGVVPCTWIQVISEWMDSWKNPLSAELYPKVYAAYSGFFGQKRP